MGKLRIIGYEISLGLYKVLNEKFWVVSLPTTLLIDIIWGDGVKNSGVSFLGVKDINNMLGLLFGELPVYFLPLDNS
jgi:hypothetical protein